MTASLTRSAGGTVAKEVVLTAEGYRELKERLDFLTTERRREIAAAIKEAREFGDLSENAEYDAAKNEQAILEDEIAELEEQLRDAKVIEKGDRTVYIGPRLSQADRDILKAKL